MKNGADAVNAAYETHVIGYDDKGAVQKNGIFGYYDYANWDFSIVDPSTLPDEEEGMDPRQVHRCPADPGCCRCSDWYFLITN